MNALSINDWSEYVYCGGKYKQYNSKDGQCLSKNVPENQKINVEEHIATWYYGFNNLISQNSQNPINEKDSATYIVYKHESENT